MTDARLKPADFRRRAFALMRECWKLLLNAENAIKRAESLIFPEQHSLL